jgi:hypothetical protein
MKRTISLILSAILLLLCAAAGAESAFTAKVRGRFELTGPLPAGYRYTVDDQNDMMTRATITSDDAAKPVLTLTISFNELYADVDRLNDLPADQLQLIKDGFLAENSVTFEDAETSLGTKLLIVREDGDDLDFLVIYTIYRGHEIELQLRAGEKAAGGALTDKQVNTWIDFLSQLDFKALDQ